MAQFMSQSRSYLNPSENYYIQLYLIMDAPETSMLKHAPIMNVHRHSMKIYGSKKIWSQGPNFLLLNSFLNSFSIWKPFKNKIFNYPTNQILFVKGPPKFSILKYAPSGFLGKPFLKQNSLIPLWAGSWYLQIFSEKFLKDYEHVKIQDGWNGRFLTNPF